MRDNGDSGAEKEVRMGYDGQQTRLLKEGAGGMAVPKNKEVVVLTIADDGKVIKSVELDEDLEQPENFVLTGSEGNLINKGVIEYQFAEEDRDWAGSGLVATVSTRKRWYQYNNVWRMRGLILLK